MAKRNVTAAAVENNHPAANGGESVNLVGLRAAVFESLARIADKESDRDELQDGSRHEFELTVSGTVDGCGFEQSFSGSLNIGHASERASSTGPNQDHLLAYVLAKLNTATREKILRETADEFAAAGELPAVDESIVEAAKGLRGELRQKVTQYVRGSVRCEYAAAAAPVVRFAAVG